MDAKWPSTKSDVTLPLYRVPHFEAIGTPYRAFKSRVVAFMRRARYLTGGEYLSILLCGLMGFTLFFRNFIVF